MCLSFFLPGREKQLAIKLSELIQEKCKLLNKVSLVQKEVRHNENNVHIRVRELRTLYVATSV